MAEQPKSVQAQKNPEHIAVIMDGNGRWALSRGEKRSDGHRAGAEAVRNLVQGALNMEIPYITIYAFSTENWSRPKMEVDFLFRLLSHFIEQELQELKANGVRVRFIGRRDRISSFFIQQMERMEGETKDNSDLTLTLAIDYGGRDELHRAMEKTCKMLSESPDLQFSPEVLRTQLDAPDLPDPDLVIRTSGEMRLSNFLIYQAAYAELWFTDEMWPDFTEETLACAVADFRKRQRRFGKIK